MIHTHINQERHKGKEKERERKKIDSARHPVEQHFL